jgi:hypothetical protein
MPYVFISYRRSDQEGRYLAHMIFRELRIRYGEQSVFFDVDSRSPGLSFPMKVERALNRTDIVLVIIGPAWMQTLTERLADSRDWVRYEVAESLKRSSLPVVPICLPGVDMPQPHLLPDDLKELGWRDGVILDPFQDFESHLNRLLIDAERVLETFRAEKEEMRLARSRLVTLLAWRARQLQISEEQAALAAAEAAREAEAKAVAWESEVRAAFARKVAAKEGAARIAEVEAEIAKQRERQKQTGHNSARSNSTHTYGAGPTDHSRSGDEGGLSALGPVSLRSSAVDLSPQGKYYQHSGNFTAGAVARSLLISGLATFALAFAYAYSLLYIPFVELNFLLPCLFGLLAGMGAGLVLRWQKVRNTTVATVGGLVVGFVAVYASWAVWISGQKTLAASISVVDLAISPSSLWGWIKLVNEWGSWDIVGYKPHGTGLGIIWSLEAVLIVGASSLFAYICLDGEPYCEECGTWCPWIGLGFKFTVPNCEITELKRRLEAKEWEFLESLKVFNPDDAESWLNVDLRQCEKCGSTNTLSAQLKTIAVDEKNRRSEKSAALTTGLLITAAECSEIKRIGQKVAFPTGRS